MVGWSKLNFIPALFLVSTLIPCFPHRVLSLPGTMHANDMLNVLIDDSIKNTELINALAEFSKVIDNFDVIRGLPLGQEGHRLYGHWGFGDSIPFNRPPLKNMLERITLKEGPAAAEAAKQKIISAWVKDTGRLIGLAESMVGTGGRTARGLAGLLYSVHLLGDYSGKKLGGLQNIDYLILDLKKQLYNLYGRNSYKAKSIISSIDKILSANKSLSTSEKAFKILNYLKTDKIIKNTLSELKAVNPSIGLIFKNRGTEIIGKQVSLQSIEQAAQSRGLKNFKVVPGLLAPNGKLFVALKSGASATAIVFSIDSGIATYQYLSGDLFTHEYKEKIVRSAINGTAIGGATAVAVLLGANPAGLVVAGVAFGTYLIVDKTLDAYHEITDRYIFTPEDLQLFGLRVDSILDIKIDEHIPLAVESWK